MKHFSLTRILSQRREARFAEYYVLIAVLWFALLTAVKVLRKKV